MTKEQYLNPKTTMMEKFYLHYGMMGGSLSFYDFERFFIQWINIPIVKAYYPIEPMKVRIINALNKYFGV